MHIFKIFWNNQNFFKVLEKNFITKTLWDYDSGCHVGFSLDEITNNKFSIISKILLMI